MPTFKARVKLARAHPKDMEIRLAINIPQNLQATLQEIYATESRRVLATLIRLLGDFDLAEEALHDAFAAALEQWSRDGLPNNPRAWLVSATPTITTTTKLTMTKRSWTISCD